MAIRDRRRRSMIFCAAGCGRIVEPDPGLCQADLLALAGRAARHFDAVRFANPTNSGDWCEAVALIQLRANHDTHAVVVTGCAYCPQPV